MEHRSIPNSFNGRGLNHQSFYDQFEEFEDNRFPYQRLDGPTRSPSMFQRYLSEPDRTLFHTKTRSVEITNLPHLHSLDIATERFSDMRQWSYHIPPQYPSPSLSGPTSSYFSSDTSERQPTPMSPPMAGHPIYSPELAHSGQFVVGCGGGYPAPEEFKRVDSFACVAMHDVQHYDDSLSEGFVGDDDYTPCDPTYAVVSHEGYQPINPQEEAVDIEIAEDHSPEDAEYVPVSPTTKRRKLQNSRPLTSPRSPSKVTKRSSMSKQTSCHTKSAENDRNDNATTINRTFPCALANYGCTSTFGSKNEWKRHINTQHMRFGYWQCDQCDYSNRKPNEFNRKDLFIQHVRRMHPIDETKQTRTTKSAAKATKNKSEDRVLVQTAERCYEHVRTPPVESGCHFCDVGFEGHNKEAYSTWDERLEHIARHLDAAKKSTGNPTDPASWHVDSLLEAWLLHHEVVVPSTRGNATGYVLAETK